MNNKKENMVKKSKSGLTMTRAGRHSSFKVKVTDCNGKSIVFESVKEAAEDLGCTVAYVYNAANSKRPCRGCTVEKIAKK